MSALHLAASQNYPLLNLFWTMLEIFLFVIWIFILFRIIADIFRDHSMGGGMKALWLIFIIFLPFLGVLVYVIARGHGMAERDVKQAQAQDAAMKAYIQQAAAPSRRRRPISSPSSPNCMTRASSPTPSSPRRRPSCSAESSTI